MSGSSDMLEEKCRICLSHFNESNGKCSLMNCLAIASDSGRFELMKSVMTTCSVTLFTDKEDQEIKETFICMSCVVEIDQMLNFLQKCIHSEAIFKKVAEVKMESSSVCADGIQEENERTKLDIKVEGFKQSVSSGFDDENPIRTTHEPSVGNKDQKHECQECQKTIPSALSLTSHSCKDAQCEGHTCEVCHGNFRTSQLIKKQMEAKQDIDHYQPHLCRQRSEDFTSKCHLSLHKQRIYCAKRYSCSVCRRTFSTISSLKFHENIHLGQQPYPCTLCSKSFARAALLKDHRERMHMEIKRFRCHCGKSFSRKMKLELHIESVHDKKDKSRKYPCPECDKKFYHPYSLKNHINAHLGIKPFLCNACGSAFTTLSNLTSHFRRIHSGERQPAVKKYLCHTCGDFFTRAFHLQRHTLRKHVPNAEKKHECPICKKKFLDKSDVRCHIKLHDDVKPFVCDQCSKCFRTAWRLQAHIKRVHLEVRPFECPTCSVRFKTKSHLEKHIRTHTGEKPFPCPHCAYTCAEKSNLKKHINVHLKAM